MRFLALVVLWTVILGTVWTYSRISDSLQPSQPDRESREASGVFDIHVTPSFQISGQDNPQLIVTLNGEEIHRTNQAIMAGKPIVIGNTPVLAGENRVFIQVGPLPLTETEKDQAAEAFLLGDEESASRSEFVCVRLQIFRDGIRIPGGDFTEHADGRSEITMERKFFVSSAELSPVPVHSTGQLP